MSSFIKFKSLTTGCYLRFKLAYFAVWSTWDQEGDCSAPCGGGELRITRVCSQGDNCFGSNERSLSCNTMQCPGT